MNILVRFIFLLLIVIQSNSFACACKGIIESNVNSIESNIVSDNLEKSTDVIKEISKTSDSRYKILKEENKLLNYYLRLYSDSEGILKINDFINHETQVILKKQKTLTNQKGFQ